MILGLRPSSFEFIYNASSLLKKDLLYFEQVHVCSFNEFTIFDEIESFDPQYFNLIQKELKPLFNNHLLHTFNLTEMLDFVYRESGKKVTPELEPFYYIHSKIPIPDEKVSWEKIIEYRKDPDTTAKFNALRVWMQDISRQIYSKNEIGDRIDHLLHEYDQHLKFHKLKYTHGTFRVFMTTLSEILEGLATLKFSKVTETLLSLSEKKLDIFEAEMSAPGREIAYIIKAKKILE